MIKSWVKVNETILFVDDFLKHAEESSLILPNLSSFRSSIDFKEASLIDPKLSNWEKSRTINQVLRSCSELQKEVNFDKKDFWTNEERVDWAYDNFNKYLDYKLEAWYDEGPIGVVKEL